LITATNQLYGGLQWTTADRKEGAQLKYCLPGQLLLLVCWSCCNLLHDYQHARQTYAAGEAVVLF